MPREPRACPKCGASLEGDLIWDTLYDLLGNEEETDKAAENYGATRMEGRWHRAIDIYDRSKDRTVAHLCPDCGYKWSRD